MVPLCISPTRTRHFRRKGSCSRMDLYLECIVEVNTLRGQMQLRHATCQFSRCSHRSWRKYTSFMVLSPCEHIRLIFVFLLLLGALCFKKLKMTNTSSFIMPSHTVSHSRLPASICTRQGHETDLVPVFPDHF